MGVLRDSDREKVRKRLDPLRAGVKLVVFTQELECDYCKQTREIAEELAGLSDRIDLAVKDFVADAEEASHLGIDKIPAVAVLRDDGTDFGIRFYGIPAGYEFASLLESIELVSTGETGFAESVRRKLAAVDVPLELQVFVTPTCPYCPRAVVQAFKFAVENEHLRAAMVEATEFPHLSNKYGVSGVPHTVIGTSQQPMVGAYPDDAALELLLAAARAGTHGQTASGAAGL